MEENIYILAQKLSKLIKNSSDFLELENLEYQINNDEEVMRAAYAKDLACSNYSDILKYHNRDDHEAKEAYLKLYEANNNLNNIPIVKKYNKAFQNNNDLLRKINSILFDGIINEGKC